VTAANKPAKKPTKRDTVLLMRTTGPNGESHGGFVWPLKVGAKVAAKDWSREPVCGGGLHGLLWGQGDGGLLNRNADAKWLLVEADRKDVVEIDGAKAKCRACVVRYVGDKAGAVAFMVAHAPESSSVLGAARAVGDNRAAVVGDSGQATAGDSGQATAGYSGQATAGDSGQATAGDSGQATAGYRGQAKAGDLGTVIIRWCDSDANRYRVTVGYVGENGIKPDTFYRCDEAGKLVEVQP
jgi:hypothetical protein